MLPLHIVIKNARVHVLSRTRTNLQKHKNPQKLRNKTQHKNKKQK